MKDILCGAKGITTFFFFSHHVARCIASGWNKILVHLGMLETEVDKLDVGSELYINKFQVLQSKFDSLKVLTGVMIKDNRYMHL